MVQNLILNAPETLSKHNHVTTDLAHLSAPGLAGAHGLSVLPIAIPLENQKGLELAGATMGQTVAKVNQKRANHVTGQSAQ